MSITRQLLSGVVDFAGTYPPASLSVADAVAEYRAASESPHAWMLGRLVWPVARLDELRAARRSLGLSSHETWSVTGVVGGDVAAELASVRAVTDDVVVDALEIRATGADDVAKIAAVVDAGPPVYVEIASASDPAPALDAVKEHGMHAKIRTGGVTADAFPSPASVMRFAARCIERDVQFKATAGLHHPIRGDYPLTYEQGCPRGAMFGFVNLLVAVALMERGEAACAAQALEEADARAFVLGDDVVRWRDRELGSADVGAARRRLHSFGSCSFREPVADLVAMGAL